MELALTKKIDKTSKFIATYNDNTCFVKYQERNDDNTDDLIKALKEMPPEKIKKLLLKGDKKSEKLFDLLDKKCRSEKYLSECNTIFDYEKKDVMFMPDLSKERECIYMFGSSGSGKSYLVKQYAQLYKKYNKDNDIFLISSLDEDKTLIGLKYKKIPLDADLINDIDIETLEDSLVIFDDSDTPKDKELEKAIFSLKNDIVQKGRHKRISAIITTHLACDFLKTRILLAECCKFVIFPGAGGLPQQERLLVTYGGMGKDVFRSLETLCGSSRWILFHNHAPNYIVHQYGVKLLRSFQKKK